MGSALHSRLPFPDPPPTRPTSLRARILFLSVAWLAALVPFLFWRGTWFGRPLSDQQLGDYLHDKNPSRVHHALMQLADRMAHKDPIAENWYPELLMLAAAPEEEVRSADAVVMGEDPTRPEFHEALQRMLADQSLAVRCQAALSLVHFDDSSGHDQIVALLRGVVVRTPHSGRVLSSVKAGSNVVPYAVLAKVQSSDGTYEVRAPIAGRVRRITAQNGGLVSADNELMTLDASQEQVSLALGALRTIGRPEDLSAVEAYTSLAPEIPEGLRQQAILTEKAIRDRSDTPQQASKNQN